MADPTNTARIDAAAAAICERRNALDWPCNGLDYDEEMARVALAAADAVNPPKPVAASSALVIENALLRQVVQTDGELLQFARLTQMHLYHASGPEAANRLSELVRASDKARDAARSRGIVTNG